MTGAESNEIALVFAYKGRLEQHRNLTLPSPSIKNGLVRNSQNSSRHDVKYTYDDVMIWKYLPNASETPPTHTPHPPTHPQKKGKWPPEPEQNRTKTRHEHIA